MLLHIILVRISFVAVFYLSFLPMKIFLEWSMEMTMINWCALLACYCFFIKWNEIIIILLFALIPSIFFIIFHITVNIDFPIDMIIYLVFVCLWGKPNENIFLAFIINLKCLWSTHGHMLCFQILKCDMHYFLRPHTSLRVLFNALWVGDQLARYTAQPTSSTQNSFGIFLLFNILWAILNIKKKSFYDIFFCMYVTINGWCITFSSQYVSSSFEVNSPCRLDLMAFTLWPLSFSTSALTFLKISNTSGYCLRKWTQDFSIKSINKKSKIITFPMDMV